MAILGWNSVGCWLKFRHFESFKHDLQRQSRLKYQKNKYDMNSNCIIEFLIIFN